MTKTRKQIHCKSFHRNHLVFLLLASVNCFAQDKGKDGLTDVTKLTFFNPGISYEHSIGKFQSIYAQAFLNTSIGLSYSSSFGFNSYVHADPAVAVQYRCYYNFTKRSAKGRRTEMNSLNYLSIITESTFSRDRISSSYYPEQDRRLINTIGVAWGMQRNYPKRFSVDLSIGPGFLFTKVTTVNDTGQLITKKIDQFTTVGQLSLGFWINRKG